MAAALEFEFGNARQLRKSLATKKAKANSDCQAFRKYSLRLVPSGAPCWRPPQMADAPLKNIEGIKKRGGFALPIRRPRPGLRFRNQVNFGCMSKGRPRTTSQDADPLGSPRNRIMLLRPGHL